jgi:hypothetical protein
VIDLAQNLSFGFEQTFTIFEWWSEPGFVSTSDTPLKRQKMKEYADALSAELGQPVKQSVDVWNHMQYEVGGFFVTMDPGSLEIKTPPCLLEDVEAMARPMFAAAEKSGLVPWRSWWYGVKGGTEGGCHVNMGGFSPETNPLREQPQLVLRYFAWLHNHPEFHYPFMGPDTGPGGNAQRMDEHEVENSLAPLEKLLLSSGMNPEYPREALAHTTLVTEKSSFPSLTKFKAPDYFIEDRAQEAPHTAEELRLVCEWRVRVLERLRTEVPALERFPRGYWHGHRLSSVHLWERFVQTAKLLQIDPAPYRVFFDRQFPVLKGGMNISSTVEVREGRRPRVITAVQRRDDGTVISKTLDTRHKRFEVSVPRGVWVLRYGSEILSPDWHAHGDGFYACLDLFVDDKERQLEFHLDGNLQGRFSPFNMTWI